MLTTWWQNSNFFCGAGNQTPPFDVTDPVFSPGSPSKCDFTSIPLVPLINPATLTVTKVSQTGTDTFTYTTSGFPADIIRQGVVGVRGDGYVLTAFRNVAVRFRSKLK